jgi:hypothetical protein
MSNHIESPENVNALALPDAWARHVWTRAESREILAFEHISHPSNIRT